ncbi:hypothetical protein ACT691_06625 [Vibrio metschnikovii]
MAISKLFADSAKKRIYHSKQETTTMAEVNSYQMAIDLLCCHLGLTVEEAKQQLGITTQPTM